MLDMKIQCGYEDRCRQKSCFDCKRRIKLKYKIINLAEATCIEDFADVDLEQWMKEKPKDVELSQNIMRKLMKQLDW